VRLTDLPTPAAVVDLNRVEANCRWMAERAVALGVALRPHVKTHKCPEAARLQVGGSPGGITVSTLAEAGFFAAAGFRDITYAVPVAPKRVRDALNIAERIDRLSLLVDSHEAVRAIEEAARNGRVPVFLKVDCGYGRAGVNPHTDGAIALAERLHRSSSVEFRGLLTHGGHSYDCVDRLGIAAVADQERDAVVGFAQRLRVLGIPVPEVSVGSTPTMRVAEDLRGVTEIRPGNYVFFDGFQSMIGSCDIDEVAFSVLSTVIGSHPDRSTLVLDAGALALSKDPGATHVDPTVGFGVLCDPQLRPLAHLHLGSLSQEHGKAAVSGGPMPQVGDRLRIIPNHSCLSAALFDRYAVVRQDTVVETWHPVRGW
jgi:D-serine deaminase-like pyridoxal phosphate-dependent protein